MNEGPDHIQQQTLGGSPPHREPERVCGVGPIGAAGAARSGSRRATLLAFVGALRGSYKGELPPGQVRALAANPLRRALLAACTLPSPIPEVADAQRAVRDRALAPSAQGGPERGSAPGSAESLRRAAAPSTERVPAPQASAVTRRSHHENVAAGSKCERTRVQALQHSLKTKADNRGRSPDRSVRARE